MVLVAISAKYLYIYLYIRLAPKVDRLSHSAEYEFAPLVNTARNMTEYYRYSANYRYTSTLNAPSRFLADLKQVL